MMKSIKAYIFDILAYKFDIPIATRMSMIYYH